MNENRIKKFLVLLTASMILTGCGQTAATYNEQGNVSQSETGESKDAGKNTEVSEGATTAEATETTEEVIETVETTEEVVETVETTEEVVETTEEATEVVEEVKEVKSGAYDEKEFFEYVNAKRTEAGLGTYEWSDEVAEQAKEMAKVFLEEGTEPEKESGLQVLTYVIGNDGEFNSNLYEYFFNGAYDTLMAESPSKLYTEGNGAVVSYYDGNGKYRTLALFSLKDSYSYEEMDNVRYYAANSVNVRDLPSTDGEKLTSLAKGEEVTVNGRCNETGWYRIVDSNGGIGYVSDNYLSTEKPVIQVAESTAQNPQQSAPEQPQPEQSGSDVLEYTGGGTEEDFWNWLLAQVESGSISMEYTVETYGEKWDTGRVDRSFIDYLNEQRVVAGLNPLEWASDLEEVAKQRAVEAVAEFANNTPHAGVPADCGENLLYNSSGDIQTNYTQWYNSPGHKANMFNPDYTRAVYAVYADGTGYYYAVTLFQF